MELSLYDSLFDFLKKIDNPPKEDEYVRGAVNILVEAEA